MKKFLSILLTLLIFSFITTQINAASTAKFTNISSQTIISGGTETVDLIYKNNSGQDLYLGSCSYEWSWTTPRTNGIPMLQVGPSEFKTSTGFSYKPKPVDVAFGGALGETNASSGFYAFDKDYNRIELKKGATFTARMQLVAPDDTTQGEKINVGINSSCLTFKTIDDYNESPTETVPVSGKFTITINNIDPTATPLPPTKTPPTSTPIPTQRPTSIPSSTSEITEDLQLDNVFSISKESTDISSLSSAELAQLENFTLDNELGQIRFLENVDLNSQEIKDRLSNLSNFIIIGDSFVEVDSEEISSFDIPAQIILRDIFLDIDKLDDIRILRDGKLDEDVDIISYSKESGELVFEVEGFSRYEISPDQIASTDNDNESSDETSSSDSALDKDNSDDDSNIMLIIIGFFGISAIVAGGVFAIMIKKGIISKDIFNKLINKK